ncbi:sugar phosphate isomerase/epimerase [Sphingomonas sp. RB3P16]|uniref:sugar phosphate isomerase/epimerase family protein n=1 Tax=Parasphingomonas frigoris TaxID=3096163 RepID=UPI002FCB9EF1
MKDLRWSYAINQWRTVETDLARLDQMESAFKTISVSGFEAIEINDNALGGHTIPAYFGSAANFVAYLKNCGLSCVSSHFSGLAHGNPAAAGDHGRMVDSAASTAAFLAELGGSCLVMRPCGPYWKEAPITEAKIGVIAECCNKVGAATKANGVVTAVHFDFLGGIRRAEDIRTLLAMTDPDLVHVALDTAELTIAGIDPVAFLREHGARVAHVQYKDAKVVDSFDDYARPNAEMEYWPAPIITAGADRGIDRWYYEMGTPGGLVDFPAVTAALTALDYAGWIVVESDQSPHVEESVMLNGWYKKQLLAGQNALPAFGQRS